MKDYKDIWDNLSVNFNDAAFFVCCIDDEDEIRTNGALTASFLREVFQITPDDKVLEIGCGIGRIGREFAPYCGEWHGADISGNMIAYAKERTGELPNVYLHELPQSDLSIFSDNYFDCVYSTIVFMHLDKVEMFTYMEDAFRLLAPGGSVYFDTYNLLSPGGWREFRGILEKFPYGMRPGHVSQFSTAQEMRKFMEEAGFINIHIDAENNEQLVLALGQKPADLGIERASSALRPPISVPEQVKAPRRPTPQEMERQIAELLTLVPALDEVSAQNAALQLEIDDLRESILAKSSYISNADQALQAKNRHIQRLEKLLGRQESLLKALPVRVAVRAVRLRNSASRKR